MQPKILLIGFYIPITIWYIVWLYLFQWNPSEETCANIPHRIDYIDAATFEHNYLFPNECFVRQLDNNEPFYRTVRKANKKEIESTEYSLMFR